MDPFAGDDHAGELELANLLERDGMAQEAFERGDGGADLDDAGQDGRVREMPLKVGRITVKPEIGGIGTVGRMRVLDQRLDKVRIKDAAQGGGEHLALGITGQFRDEAVAFRNGALGKDRYDGRAEGKGDGALAAGADGGVTFRREDNHGAEGRSMTGIGQNGEGDLLDEGRGGGNLRLHFRKRDALFGDLDEAVEAP